MDQWKIKSNDEILRICVAEDSFHVSESIFWFHTKKMRK